MREGDLNLQTKKVPAVVVAGALSRFVISPNLRKCIRDKGTLTLRGMQHPDNAYLSLIRSLEVICSIPKKNVESVVIFTVGSEDKAQMPSSVAGRADIWLGVVNIIGVRMEIMLSLCLIPRILL